MSAARPPPPPPPPRQSISPAGTKSLPPPPSSPNLTTIKPIEGKTNFDNDIPIDLIGKDQKVKFEENISKTETQFAWYKDKKSEEWILGEIISEHGDKVELIKKNDISKVTFKLPSNETYKFNTGLVDDMTSLIYLHEPGILHNLRERYSKSLIYTFMGTALIAMNPFQNVSSPDISTFVNSKGLLSPHPYAIAENAFKNLILFKQNQSIIIGGESGAGKTETAKIITKYLTDRNRYEKNSNQATDQLLHDKILFISPILESFGNAKTSRNQNSSRFGKFMKLIFDSQKSSNSLFLSSALIETYLLEKSRVVFQNNNEQNYHIFYALVQSLPKELIDIVSKYIPSTLPSGYQFRILPQMTDTKNLFLLFNLQEVTNALLTIGLSNDVILGIYKILLGILFLGNISFESVESSEGYIAGISGIDKHFNNLTSQQLLKLSSELLDIQIDQLKGLLLQREMETRNERIVVNLTVKEANYTRDAIIKAIYEMIFQYLIVMINRSLTKDQNTLIASNQDQEFIGILDIFGFENFTSNYFEQLLINYANEFLQHLFNQQIYEKELLLLQEEKISNDTNFSLDKSQIPNNLPCVDLLSGKGSNSIFTILDTISRQSQGSDDRFFDELHKILFNKHQHFGNVHRKDMKYSFVVKHYAATVTYHNHNQSQGNPIKSSETPSENMWLLKNTDPIPDGLELVYQNSDFLRLYFLTSINRDRDPAGSILSPAAPKRRKSVMMKPTIVSIFTKSMFELHDVLSKTQCHFIRCIKPNSQAKPALFDTSYILQQIHALGVLQTCQILSINLPIRLIYDDVIKKFSPLPERIQQIYDQMYLDTMSTDNPEQLKDLMAQIPDKISPVLLISCILLAYDIPKEAYELGLCRIFFRAQYFSHIEKLFAYYENYRASNKSNYSGDENKYEKNDRIIQTKLEKLIKQFFLLKTNIVKYQKQIDYIIQYSNKIPNQIDSIAEHYQEIMNELQMATVPSRITENIIRIEQNLNQFSNVYKLHSKNMVAFQDSQETLASMSLFNDTFKPTSSTSSGFSSWITNWKQLQIKRDEYLDYQNSIESLWSQVDFDYKSVHQNMEANESKILSQSIIGEVEDSLQNIRKVYEVIDENVMKNEDVLLNTVVLHIERGLFSLALEEQNTMKSELIEINDQIKDFITRMDKMDGLLNTLKNSVSSIDYRIIENQIDNLLQKLLSGINLVNHKEPIFDQFKAELLKLQTQAHQLSNQPESPGPTLPPAPATIPLSPELNSSEPSRRSSINYSIKDLKLLKSKQPPVVESNQNSMLNSTSASLSSTFNSTFSTNPPNSSTITSTLSSNLMDRDDEALAPLLPNWKEFFDPKSSRYYYVNRITKKKQWQRPSLLKDNDSEIGNDSNTPVTPVKPKKPTKDSQENELPLGWKAILDPKSQRYYYVNSLTGQKQWRKPAEEVIVDQSNESPSKIESVDRLSKRFSNKLSLSPTQSNPTSPGESVNLTQDKINRARRTSALVLNEAATKETELSQSMKQSVSYMLRIGSQVKTGYLMKQSKLLGRWRKRFFVLTEQMICYFDSEKEYQQMTSSSSWITKLKADKQFHFTGKTLSSYTTTENCFSITNEHPGGNGEETVWFLLSPNESEMDEWIRAINSHIHVRYVNENHLTDKDFWNEGKVTLSIWKVPWSSDSSVQRKPVGIRTLPIVDGPRTGEGLYPGDIVEIQQIIDSQVGKEQHFLRLANDQGWVFEFHPQADYSIMIEMNGKIQEKLFNYLYPEDNLESLLIYSSPHCHPDTATGESLSPGSRFQGCAEWSISSSFLFHSASDEDDALDLIFVKLVDGRGWVEKIHQVTGSYLLQEIK